MKDDKLSEHEAWQRVYLDAMRDGKTFRQARAWFFCMYHYWPSRNLRDMPKNTTDWMRPVGDVPACDLTGYYLEHFEFLETALPVVRRRARNGNSEAEALIDRYNAIITEIEQMTGIDEKCRGESVLELCT